MGEGKGGGDRGDGLVGEGEDVGVCWGDCWGGMGGRVASGRGGGNGVDETPDSTEPALDADDARFVPFEDFGYGGLEEDVRAGGVGAVFSDAGGWVDAVVLALAHFFPAYVRYLPGFGNLGIGVVLEIQFLWLQEASGVWIGVRFAVDHSLTDEFLERFTVTARASTERPEWGSGDELGEKPGV